MDYSAGFLTLEWDKPKNCETVQDVTVYDVRFKPCTSLERKDYHMMTVKVTARNNLLTREYGLKLLKNYEFEVRAQNAGYEGNWSGILEHINWYVPMCMFDKMVMQTSSHSKILISFYRSNCSKPDSCGRPTQAFCDAEMGATWK